MVPALRIALIILAVSLRAEAAAPPLESVKVYVGAASAKTAVAVDGVKEVLSQDGVAVVDTREKADVVVDITERGIRESVYGESNRQTVDSFLEASLYVAGNHVGGLVATCGRGDVKGFYLDKEALATARWTATNTKLARQIEDWIGRNRPLVASLKAGKGYPRSPSPTPRPKIITAWSAAQYPEADGQRLFVRLERVSETDVHDAGMASRPRLLIDCRDHAVSIDFTPLVVGDTLEVGFDDEELLEYPTRRQGYTRWFGTRTLVQLLLARQTLVVRFVQNGNSPQQAEFDLRGLDDALAGCTDGPARPR